MDEKEGGDTRLIGAGVGIMIAVLGSFFLCETALRGKCPSIPKHIAYSTFAPENLSERWREVPYKSVKPNRRQIDNTRYLAVVTDSPFEIDAALCASERSKSAFRHTRSAVRRHAASSRLDKPGCVLNNAITFRYLGGAAASKVEKGVSVFDALPFKWFELLRTNNKLRSLNHGNYRLKSPDRPGTPPENFEPLRKQKCLTAANTAFISRSPEPQIRIKGPYVSKVARNARRYRVSTGEA